MASENIGITLGRQTKNQMISHYFISNEIIEKKYSEASTQCYCLPLYTYDSFGQTGFKFGADKKTNFNIEIVNRILGPINLHMSANPESDSDVTELDVFDYCYAILYSPAFRKKFYDQLKINFPKIPYPANKENFIQLAERGRKLRKLHLMEAEALEDFISTYPINGSNEVSNKINAKDWEIYDKGNQLGRIWINKKQYFEGIPLVAWNFYIGGYQPAQKWLKDRVGRTLSFDDILHYQKIIVALSETDKLMKEIDLIEQ